MNDFQQPVGPIVTNWTAPPHPTSAPMIGRYCRLEGLDPARHADSLFAANKLDEHGLNWTYLSYGPFAQLDEYRDWLERVCTGSDPLFYAIVDPGTGDAVGVASYLNIVPANGSIEVGHLNYSPRLQRTRAATEAMYLMMARAFELGYRRYEWKCNALNASSRSAAQRLGFTFEGIFRQHMVVKGRNRDTAWYAVIDSAWPALQTAFRRWLDPSNFDESGNQKQSLSELTTRIQKPSG